MRRRRNAGTALAFLRHDGGVHDGLCVLGGWQAGR